MLKFKIHDVRALPGDSAFLIDDGETSILYDSGFAFTGYRVADNIKNILGKRKLDYIFLTHSHYDHALGSVYVKKYWPEARVCAGEYAAKIFEKPSAKRLMRELDGKFAAENGICDYEDLIDDLSVDIPLKDGDKIKAGKMEFTAVALPGHTKCSIGYYLADEKLLLGSETLGVYYCEGEVTPAFLIGLDVTLSSIKKAQAMDIENILLPHFGLADKEHTAYYLREGEKCMVSTAEDIADILRKGESDPVAAENAALEYFKNRFYRGYVINTYPPAAMELNTKIMINIVKKEILGQIN